MSTRRELGHRLVTAPFSISVIVGLEEIVPTKGNTYDSGALVFRILDLLRDERWCDDK